MTDAAKPTKIFYDAGNAVAHADPSADSPRHFVLMIEGQKAGFIEYSLYGMTAIVTHTEIHSRYGNQGLGTELASEAVRFFASQGWQAVPVCGFFARHLRSHPEHAAVATPASRRIFEL
jgi:predicted GNAT family acetyltransferase